MRTVPASELLALSTDRNLTFSAKTLGTYLASQGSIAITREGLVEVTGVTRIMEGSPQRLLEEGGYILRSVVPGRPTVYTWLSKEPPQTEESI